ncbi:MAG TPA: response regulator transcription factor [Syntrophomonadaceae bacterium]|nr:response regulator transcription factor [Syntrophomonadaceae bacterium]
MTFKEKSILVVEDDQNIAELIRLYLANQGYRVIISLTGRGVVEQVQREGIDLVILDLRLPHVSGWEICRALRQQTTVPIIIVTAKRDISDKLRGFDLGADDYIVKPFDPLELLARVRAVLKRSQASTGGPESIILPGLEIDLGRYEVRVNNQLVELTPKETELLYTLASQPNHVLTREYLLKRIWGYAISVGTSRTVDVHINRLRDKIEKPGVPWRIKTVWGVGYKFENEAGQE